MRPFALFVCLLPGSLAAQGFDLPEGCEGFLTVQQRGCTLSNHYICEQDTEGDQWRIDFGPNGPVYAARINYETEWVESYSLGTGDRRELAPDPADPANFTEMMETGVDTYDFITSSDSGQRRQWSGSDRLRGVTEDIDGITLEVMDYETRVSNPDTGEQIYVSVGVNYVSTEWRLFLPGESTTFFPDGEQVERDNTPVDFIFPGETGFFSTVPLYDCGADTVSYPD